MKKAAYPLKLFINQPVPLRAEALKETLPMKQKSTDAETASTARYETLETFARPRIQD